MLKIAENLDFPVAVELGVFHGRAYVRDHDERHLDILEGLNQTVRCPALWLTETVSRLGSANAEACGFDRRLVSNCIKLMKRRHASAD